MKKDQQVTFEFYLCIMLKHLNIRQQQAGLASEHSSLATNSWR